MKSTAIYMSKFYNEQWFVVTLAAFFGAVGYFFKDYRNKRKEVKHQRKSQTLTDGLRAHMRTAHSLSNIKNLQRVGRVFLAEVSNNGDLPAPGSHMYCRVIDVKIEDYQLESYGRKSKGELWNKERFAEIEVDDRYIWMVLQAKSKGCYTFITKQEPDCILKRIYIEQSIDVSLVYHIYSDVNKWKEFILSVSSYNGHPFDDVELMAMIENEVHEIRQNFHKFR